MQQQQLKLWGALAAFCLLGVPVLIYVFGGLLVGPYQGEGGLLGMMGAIYIDALTGHLAALILLLAPAILVGIWLAVAHIRRRLPG